MRSTLIAFLAMTTFVPACGTMDDSNDADVELSQLGGLDLPADYAGGRYVHNLGALAVGGSMAATMSGRDLYHGYTVTARRGETIRLRGLTSMYMALVAIYGPQAADGSWGPQVAKKWSWPFTDRSQWRMDIASIACP